MLQLAGILYPDVEAWAVGYLQAALDERPEPVAGDVLVSNRVPTTRQSRMVIVRRDGGTPNGLFDNPRLSWRTWAGTEEDAHDLAVLVAALLMLAPDGDPVVRAVVESGPTAVADESGDPQRLSLATLRTRGKALS